MTSISLLREKFTIREAGVNSAPVITLGNRLIIELPKHDTPLIIRGHSMYMTLRMGAEIMRQLSYVQHVENAEKLLNWGAIWTKLVSPYEKTAIPNTWIAIYYKGKAIYQDNFHHMFFDIIEQCEYKNNVAGGQYDKSIIMAQKAFQRMEKSVMIEEESHVGFILSTENVNELRFAIILRMPGHTGTFTTRLGKNIESPTVHNTISVAADYIEAINMAVRIGFAEGATKGKKPERKEARDLSDMKKRLTTLSINIEQAEKKYTMLYRPERPDFQAIIKKCVEI